MAVVLVVVDPTDSTQDDANTYQSIADANTRLEALFPLMGLSATVTISNTASMTAGTIYLNNLYGMSLLGIRTYSVQTQEYPRVNVPKDSRGTYYYDSDELPGDLLDAHAMACYYAENEPSSLRPNLDAGASGAVKRSKDQVGPLVEEREYVGGSTPYKTYSVIDDYMSRLMASGSQVRRA